MTDALFIISIFFVILGGLLLIWRMAHIFFLDEFWNNTPLTLSWGVTIVFAGVAVAFAGFLSSFEDCRSGCDRTGTQPGSLWIVGGIVVGAGLVLMFCQCGRDKPVHYDWATKEDNRGVKSGLDFVALGIGIAILSALASMGDCPSSCARA